MTVELVALTLTLIVHLIGAGVLVWALMDGDRPDWRSLWPRDDDDGGGPGVDGSRDGGPPRGGTGVLPPGLDGEPVVPSGVRLREPGRISEHHPRPPRRPQHEPRPRPRVPERT